eukprot:TRINITY_DN1235_c0_g6_i1.p1 TRINITY_DN1235_c0_g6~~TRINITY_DN1235_c0_g6_i1.p1  ORF type:complete len:1136 (-),score=143.83 TRINITY_DN1235_c0_g6_i1:1075-4482(-)
MGQAGSTQYSSQHGDFFGLDGSRSVTFSEEIGPLVRARALVAQARGSEPLPGLLALYYDKLAAALGEASQSPGVRSPRKGSPKSPLSAIGALTRGSSQSSGHVSAHFSLAAPVEILERWASGGSEEPDKMTAARLEYEWFVAKFDRFGSHAGVPPKHVMDVYVAGLACWLEFWLEWGDGPGHFSGKEEEEEEEEMAEGKVEEKQEQGKQAPFGHFQAPSGNFQKELASKREELVELSARRFSEANFGESKIPNRIRVRSDGLAEENGSPIRRSGESGLATEHSSPGIRVNTPSKLSRHSDENGRVKIPEEAMPGSPESASQISGNHVIRKSLSAGACGNGRGEDAVESTSQHGNHCNGIEDGEGREQVEAEFRTPSNSLSSRREGSLRTWIMSALEKVGENNELLTEPSFELERPALSLDLSFLERPVSPRYPSSIKDDEEEDDRITEMETMSSCDLSPRRAGSWKMAWMQAWGQVWLEGWPPGRSPPISNSVAAEALAASRGIESWGGSLGNMVANLGRSWGQKFGSPNGTSAWTWTGPLCTLQEAALADALKGQGTQDVSPTRTEVLRILGVAAFVSEWQPLVASLCLLRLLDRLGRYLTSGRKSMSPLSARDAELRAARKFTVACLVDILDSCGVAGGGPWGLGPCEHNDRCPPRKDDSMSPRGLQKGQLSSKGSVAGFPSPDSEIDAPSSDQESDAPLPGTGLLHVSEIAELTIADSLARKSSNRHAVCQAVDKLHVSGKFIGPGVIAAAFSNFLEELPNVWPQDLLQLAGQLDNMGCTEAGFRVRLRVLANTSASSALFQDIVPLAFVERGYEPVPLRVARLFAAASTAMYRAPGHAARYAYAKRFSAALIRPLQEDRQHPWAFQIAQTYLRISGQLGPMGADEASVHDSNILLCALILTLHLVGCMPEEAKAGGLARWIQNTREPGQTVGWLAWKAIGRMLEMEDAKDESLPLMWSKAVLGTYEAVSEEGTGVDNEALEIFDWGCESILMALEAPMAPDGVLALLASGLSPPLPQEKRCRLLLSISARMSCNIYWRWTYRKETARFVARILKHIRDKENPSAAELQFAIVIATRLWGWTLPSRKSVYTHCESAQEAKELMDNALMATWDSVATWEGEGPLTCVGKNWPL